MIIKTSKGTIEFNSNCNNGYIIFNCDITDESIYSLMNVMLILYLNNIGADYSNIENRNIVKLNITLTITSRGGDINAIKKFDYFKKNFPPFHSWLARLYINFCHISF